MSNFLQDIAVLLFAAGKEIEKKSEEYRKKRESRYSEFDEKFKHTREKVKSKFDEEIEKARAGIKEFSGRLGVASKDEIEELKKQISELVAKLDAIEKKIQQ